MSTTLSDVNRLGRLFFDLGQSVPAPLPPVAARPSREDEYVLVDGVTKVRCGACGVLYGIGDSPACKDGHGRVRAEKGFEPHFDVGLGRWVSGWGDVHQAMREQQLDYRDHPSPGETSVRLDKIAERKRRAAR